MKTGNEILTRSLSLIGEVPQEENETLKERSVELINLILSQLYELELSLRGERRNEAKSIPQITSLSDTIPFSQPILFTLIPLGLAGYLLNEEEPSRSSFFLSLYQTERELVRARCKNSRRHKINRSF